MVKSQELSEAWKNLIVGQEHAIEMIVPYVVRAQAGLNTPGRPVGVMFLLGPTGTGKTRTPETLAEILHGTEKNVLRIDCGEYQMDHEIAKLIGAPPGYLGHRETHPALSVARINAVVTENSPISIILFDEIEKASPAMWRILLGILDKATLKLGDNTSADFSKSIIFMSSNLGAKEMSDRIKGGIGFTQAEESAQQVAEDYAGIQKIGMTALEKKFPPEFQNRVDEVITYKPLTFEHLQRITKLELEKVQKQLFVSLGVKAFRLYYEATALDAITKKGTSTKYGARELKRVINRLLLNPMADEFLAGTIRAGADVTCRSENGDTLVWSIENPGPFAEIDEDPPFVIQPEEERPSKRSKRRSTKY